MLIKLQQKVAYQTEEFVKILYHIFIMKAWNPEKY